MQHDYIVNIVGDGPYLQTLKKSARNTNIKVNFLGFIDNNSRKFAELYEKSKIFVFTSEAENFPVVLLEAMIAGLAIITTNDTGCAEVVGDSGILVDSKNPNQIKEALEKLIRNPGLCAELGKAARKRAEEHFSWDVVTAKYLHLFDRLIERPAEIQTVKI